MKNTKTLMIVSMLLWSGFGASIIQATNNQTYETMQVVVSFSQPIVTNGNDGLLVSLAEATSVLNTPGGYMLPQVTKVFNFPFCTQIIGIDVVFSDITTQILTQEPARATQPVSDLGFSAHIEEIDLSTYTLYPENQYSYSLATGRQGDSIVLFVVVRLNPVQFNQKDMLLTTAKTADITITYRVPEHPTILADTYDLLIITPDDFAAAVEPLVVHKNAMGVQTKLVTRSEICDGTYFPAQGRDCAEELKYFIKSALESWGIKYVLLVGGRKGGVMQEKWWMPVRYSNLDDSSGFEASYLSDLYFADIYDAYGNFSSWDTNENGVFAEWKGATRDILDMYPDVFVGRLACLNTREVKLMVNKIITYETETYGSAWFKRFIGVAGDTYPGPTDPYYEGERANEAAFNLLEGSGFTADMVWTSNGVFTGKQPVIDSLSQGAGFVHFSGHGNPNAWGNHPPHNDTFINGPTSFEMGKLKNKEMQPIVIVGGCHNAQFNTSLLNIVKGVLTDGLQYFSTKSPLGKYWYREWVPRCWAWAMAAQKNGGCIAIMANTGLGYGQPGENCLTMRGRFLEVLFFRSYSEGKTVLGETHGQDMIYYMHEYPPMSNVIDCKIVQQWALLGDPSLQIGGYPN
ncbi:MAG: C25 family cysteine peptidase [Candidatus Thermoplasmatota archaeon]